MLGHYDYRIKAGLKVVEYRGDKGACVRQEHKDIK